MVKTQSGDKCESQAVMIGPMLMAGLTEDTRRIKANASNLTPVVSEVSTDGLLSLRLQGSADAYLQQQGNELAVGRLQPGNAAAMAATFRMLDVTYRSDVCTMRSDVTMLGSLKIENKHCKGKGTLCVEHNYCWSPFASNGSALAVRSNACSNIWMLLSQL